MNQEDAEETIINQERAELERWCKGDPLEYSGNAADDITYFDHITKTRLDGIAAVKDHFGQFKGKVDVSKSKMVNPQDRVDGEVVWPRPGTWTDRAPLRRVAGQTVKIRFVMRIFFRSVLASDGG